MEKLAETDVFLQNLSKGRQKAVLALVECSSITEAAKQAKVSRMSIHKWIQEPEFDAAYKQCQKQLVSHAINKIKGAMSSAVATLKEIAEDKDAYAGARVSASRAILDLGLRAVEIEELEERITELEEHANNGGGE